MLTPSYTRQFKRDVELQKRRGKDMKKLKEVMELLVEQQRLPERNRDHRLVGNFKDYRECHIESDWLLLYKADGLRIYFTRTGSHSDLFE